MAGGRPTKYKPEYCEMLVKHMAQGMPYETFAAEVDCSRDILYDWEKKWPEFHHAKKRGRAKQYNALFKLGMAGTMGKVQTDSEVTTKIITDVDGKEQFKIMKKKLVNGFNSTSWIFMMKNCCGWKDRIEFSEDDEVDDIDFDG